MLYRQSQTRHNSTTMNAASVRVNASSVKDFAGRVVRIVGVVDSYDSGSQSARLNAGGSIDLIVNLGDNLEVGKPYEVIGKVGVSDFKVAAYSVMPVSENTNVDVATKLATYVQKVPELFY